MTQREDLSRELCHRAECGQTDALDGCFIRWAVLPWHKRLWYWMTDGPRGER
jgi:hypothetical protein